jgi:hypothetical protein
VVYDEFAPSLRAEGEAIQEQRRVVAVDCFVSFAASQ